MNEEDVSQFDTKFTRQTPVDSPDDTVLSESANQVFLVGHKVFVIIVWLNTQSINQSINSVWICVVMFLQLLPGKQYLHIIYTSVYSISPVFPVVTGSRTSRKFVYRHFDTIAYSGVKRDVERPNFGSHKEVDFLSSRSNFFIFLTLLRLGISSKNM